MTLKPALHNHSFTTANSTNLGLFVLQYIFIEKKSTHKGTHAAQASVAEGLAVAVVAIIIMTAKSNSRNPNYLKNPSVLVY